MNNVLVAALLLGSVFF